MQTLEGSAENSVTAGGVRPCLRGAAVGTPCEPTYKAQDRRYQTEDGLLKTTHPLPACPYILHSRGKKKNSIRILLPTRLTYLILKYLSGLGVSQATQRKLARNLTGAKKDAPACLLLGPPATKARGAQSGQKMNLVQLWPRSAVPSQMWVGWLQICNV